MSCYKIDNIIDVPANGDCMFESIWNSLDDQLREVITKEVYDLSLLHISELTRRPNISYPVNS